MSHYIINTYEVLLQSGELRGDQQGLEVRGREVLRARSQRRQLHLLRYHHILGQGPQDLVTILLYKYIRRYRDVYLFLEMFMSRRRNLFYYVRVHVNKHENNPTITNNVTWNR